MKIGLHDSENEHFKRKKRFPNLALMKISTFHKNRGDIVQWWEPLEEYDTVYSSKVFDFSPENPYLPKNTIRGGTGYNDLPLNQTLPPEIEECTPDYSIYPTCDFAIGYLTRGCPRSCRWCVVPKKEGEIRPYRKWQEVVRADTRNLTLLDNNILACDYGISQLGELASTDYKIDINQGMDARFVTPEIAKILGELKWQRYLRFSCDQIAQLDSIERVVHLLGEQGIKPYRIFLYVLVTEDLEDAIYRVETLKKHKNIGLYAQAEQNPTLGIVPNKAQKEFCHRYMYSRCYKKETWSEYCDRKGFDYDKKG